MFKPGDKVLLDWTKEVNLKCNPTHKKYFNNQNQVFTIEKCNGDTYVQLLEEHEIQDWWYSYRFKLLSFKDLCRELIDA